MNEVLQNMMARRSCRSFEAAQVAPAALDEILNAGLYAASGMGKQSPVLVAVQDAETVRELSRLNAAVMGTAGDPFYGAPTVVVVLAEESVRTWIEDGSLAIGNMMNAAESLGVASCWIHRAREVFDSDAGKALLRKWGVPEGYRGVGNCILGYRKGEKPEAAPRKDGRVYRV